MENVKTLTCSTVAMLMMISTARSIPGNAMKRETIRHDVKSTFIIKSGTASITRYDLPDEAERFLITMAYDLKAQPWIPVRGTGGETKQILPIMFASEEGYLQLAEKKILEDDEARLEFLGHETLGELANCYKVRVFPKKHKKWDGVLWYHPLVPGIGWAQVRFTLRKVPIVGKLSATTCWSDPLMRVEDKGKKKAER